MFLAVSAVVANCESISQMDQASMEKRVEMLFVHHTPSSSSEELTQGHGRIESRTCDAIDQPQLVDSITGWYQLHSIVRVRSTRQAVANGEPTEEVRFYISSAKADPERFNTWVRQHWGIEDQVHCMLDVIFDEDGSRIRRGHADQNMVTIRKTALNICRLLSEPKRSRDRQPIAAALSESYLDSLLGPKTR